MQILQKITKVLPLVIAVSLIPCLQATSHFSSSASFGESSQSSQSSQSSRSYPINGYGTSYAQTFRGYATVGTVEESSLLLYFNFTNDDDEVIAAELVLKERERTITADYSESTIDAIVLQSSGRSGVFALPLDAIVGTDYGVAVGLGEGQCTTFMVTRNESGGSGRFTLEEIYDLQFKGVVSNLIESMGSLGTSSGGYYNSYSSFLPWWPDEAHRPIFGHMKYVWQVILLTSVIGLSCIFGGVWGVLLGQKMQKMICHREHHQPLHVPPHLQEHDGIDQQILEHQREVTLEPNAPMFP